MAAIQHYDIGDVWTPQATFTVGGTPTDPTTLTVRQQTPDGTETTLANAVTVSTLTGSSTPVAKTSTGVFKLNPGITLSTSGYWFVRFEGTGAAAAAEEQQAIVDPSEFTSNGGVNTNALVTLAETKDWLRQLNIDTSNDLSIVRAINDISDMFMDEAQREIRPLSTTPEARTFEAPSGGAADPWYVDGVYMGDRAVWRRLIKVGDLTSYTQVQIIDTDWTTVLETVALSKVTALPLQRLPWEPIRYLQLNTTINTGLAAGMRVAVTGVWGFPQVPGRVRQAVLDEIARTLDRDVEHYRQDLGTPQQGEGGTTVMVGNQTGRLIALSPRAQAVAWGLRDVNVG